MQITKCVHEIFGGDNSNWILTDADLWDNTIIHSQPSPERFGFPILKVENRVGIKRELQSVASVEFVGKNSEHVYFLGM